MSDHDHAAWVAALTEVATLAETARAAVKDRDRAIRAALDLGAYQREVARAADMSHTAIQNIARRTTADA